MLLPLEFYLTLVGFTLLIWIGYTCHLYALGL
jgi:hypothetical protein